jgi:hypothetical protein
MTDVLCPGALSQVALAEGDLAEADELAIRSLTAARGLGFERHYFSVDGMRTAALLALERRDLADADRLNEQLLAMLGGGRPRFATLVGADLETTRP